MFYLIGVVCLFLTSGQCSASVDFGDVNITTSLRIYTTVNGTLQWASVCSSGLDSISVGVICRQLGNISGSHNIADIEELTPYVYTSVQCPTVSNYQLYGENHIMRCNLTGPVDVRSVPTCKATLVVCSTVSLYDTPYEGQVYLERTGNDSPSKGQLQIYLEGEWRKVCYTDSLNDAVATSVCRQLGYTGLTHKDVVKVVGRNSVEFSSYSCNQNSFPCFSHCISKPYTQSACHRVSLNCEFIIESAKFRTSGSHGTCDIPVITNMPNVKTYDHVMIAGWVAFAGCFTLVVLIIIGIGRYIWKKRSRANNQERDNRERDNRERDPLLPNDRRKYDK